MVTNPIALSIGEGEAARPNADLPSEFALFVGNVAAMRKNVYRLIKACEEARLPLVIVGLEVKSTEMSRIESLIRGCKIPIIRLGFVSSKELRWLYQACDVFCLPSIVEGVGQVALEALYFGAPVVITSVGGPPDYFGSHACYVNPRSVVSIRDGILIAREQRIDVVECRKFLSQYSMDNTARQLADSYSI